MVSWAETQGRVTAWQYKHQVAFWKAKAVALQYENKILHDIIRRNEFTGQVSTQINYHNTDQESEHLGQEHFHHYQPQDFGEYFDDDQQYAQEEYLNPEVDEQEQYEQYSRQENYEQYPHQEDDEQYSYQVGNYEQSYQDDNYYDDHVDNEQSHHDNVDQEMDDSDEAIIISDEYVNFLVINAKYQKQFELERLQRKKQQQQKDEDEEEQTVIKHTPEARNNELQNLYGQDWKGIASTMMFVEAQYLNALDLCKPAYWPVLPLNING